MSLKTRILSLFLALALSLPPLVSCSGRAVLSCGSESLDERLFSYALTLNKTKTLATLRGSSQNLVDDEAIWTTDLGDGTTYADMVLESTLKTLKMTLFYADYAQQNDVTLSADEKAAVDENLNTILKSFENRAAFDSYMGSYGFDYDLLHRYYTLDALSQAGMRAYYAHPLTSLTSADVKAYYEEHYATYIYFYVNETDVLLQNGKRVPLTDEDKKEKAALFEQVQKDVQTEEDFKKWLDRSDENVFSEKKAETTLFSDVPQAFAKELKEAEEESLFVAQGEKGRYLVYKAELSEDYFSKHSQAFLLTLISEREDVFLTEQKDLFYKDDEFFATVNVATLKIF
ncbi:MAG: hypothetical protein II328_00970 [Clostridia bacterium]|nr:hypothetical protein [Clostridia bacterium]